jgi:hypothetical protein
MQPPTLDRIVTDTRENNRLRGYFHRGGTPERTRTAKREQRDPDLRACGVGWPGVRPPATMSASRAREVAHAWSQDARPRRERLVANLYVRRVYARGARCAGSPLRPPLPPDSCADAVPAPAFRALGRRDLRRSIATSEPARRDRGAEDRGPGSADRDSPERARSRDPQPALRRRPRRHGSPGAPGDQPEHLLSGVRTGDGRARIATAPGVGRAGRGDGARSITVAGVGRGRRGAAIGGSAVA